MYWWSSDTGRSGPGEGESDKGRVNMRTSCCRATDSGEWRQSDTAGLETTYLAWPDTLSSNKLHK